MIKLSSRGKLFIVILVFAFFAAGMFTYGYGIMESRNQNRLDIVNQKNLELELLIKEQKNSEQAKQDLEQLSQKVFPPQELFSKDTKVVKEIQVLEQLADRYNLELGLRVAGTSKNATKVAGVGSDLVLVPYVVTVTGAFNNILKYVESVEHTTFVTQVTSVDISAGLDGDTRAELSSEFYLKK